MPRGVIDIKGIQSPEMQSLKNKTPPEDLPFNITKIGHVVLRCQDINKSVEFYTQVLGFRVSDVYPDSMVDGKMVFMRCNTDHHGVALVGGVKESSRNIEMHHMAFEVDTLDEVVEAREHLKKHNVQILFEGRRRAGVQIAVEFLDPDGHWLEIFWGLDQLGPEDMARPPEEWVEEFSIEDAIDNAPKGQDTTLLDPSLKNE
ncbi:MAG: VOC family protein [Pseudomonadota bacterium]|nr:VOC family protein [Pseudomonadota bacterium]